MLQHPSQPIKPMEAEDTSSSYYYSQPESVSRWHAHSRVLVFHALHRGQRYTRLCPLISYRFLRCTLTFAPT